ncbi:MAG: thiamine phosphate synthase, partial [Stackebrandtia sp.]
MNPPPSRLLVLTDARACPRRLGDQIRLALDGGDFSLVVREKHLSSERRRELAGELAEILQAAGRRLIVADPTWPVDACHLSAHTPAPVPRPAIAGRSRHAGDPPPRGLDYVTYSPIYASASKPGYGPEIAPAGLARYCRAIARSPEAVPVYALGGVDDPQRAAQC